MENPFSAIDLRLANLENLILKLFQNQQQVETTKQPEQLLTVNEAAKFLNLSVPTIYSKVSKNELPVMKRGKRLYFSQDELMSYLKQGRKKTNDEINALAEIHMSNMKKVK